MLSAQKDNQRLHEISESGDLSSFRSFTRIVDSIQGLRDLLEKVTLDEIIAAEEKARKLIYRLSLLERALGSIHEIGRCLATVRARVEDAHEKASEPATGRGAPGKHLHDHQAHQPNNLIVFPGPNRASREPAEATAFENKTRSQPTLEEAARRSTASNNDDPVEESVHSHVSRTISATSDQAHVKTGLIKAAEQAAGPSNDPSLRTIDNAPESLRDNPPYLGASAPDTVAPLWAHDPVVSQEIVDSLTAGDTWKIADEPSQGASAPTPGDNRAARQPEAVSVEFDQQLLEDLITDYGEFVTYVNLSGPADPAPPPTHSANKGTVHPTDPNASHDEPREPALTHQKTDGDLDRKLKKLIQDYGEYDLYSHRNSGNAKKGVVAFVLLGLILSGFYYFSSVPTPISDKPGLVVQPKAASNPSIAEATRKTSLQEDQGEAVKVSGASTADLASDVAVAEPTK